MKEDELLSRLEMLENQLQVYAKVRHCTYSMYCALCIEAVCLGNVYSVLLV